jgi:putative Holliday junction resolvase
VTPIVGRHSTTHRRSAESKSIQQTETYMARTIAFDYGEKRIGVAVSDPTRTIASPLTTFTRRPGKRPPWPDIARLVQEQEVDEAVIGLPLGLDGEEGAWAAEVRAFGAEVERRTGLPVRWVDERMTSVIAERAIRGMGLKKTQRQEKERVDATAAAVILEGWLARRRNAAAQAAAKSAQQTEEHDG